MPMELYSSEALVCDLVNAISKAEGRPINIGGNHHEGIDRDYAFRLVSDSKRAVEGHSGTQEAHAADKAAASRSTAIKRFIAKTERQAATSKPASPRTKKKALPASATRTRKIAPSRAAKRK
jgi:hypothetical protein